MAETLTAGEAVVTAPYPDKYDYDPMAACGDWIAREEMLDPGFAALDIYAQVDEYGRWCDAERLQLAMEI